MFWDLRDLELRQSVVSDYIARGQVVSAKVALPITLLKP